MKVSFSDNSFADSFAASTLHLNGGADAPCGSFVPETVLEMTGEIVPETAVSTAHEIVPLQSPVSLASHPKAEWESAWQELAQLALQLCRAPVAFFTQIEQGHQSVCYQTVVGEFAQHLAELTEDALPWCERACARRETMQILHNDCNSSDCDVCDEATTGDINAIEFETGATMSGVVVPLQSASSGCFGTLCVLDAASRHFEETEIASLQVLARQAVARWELALERQNRALPLHEAHSPLHQADLTQSVPAPRHFAAQVHLHTLLLDAVGQAVIATDLQGVIFHWNRSAQDLYGWSQTEVLGRNLYDLVVPSHERSHSQSAMRTLAAGQSLAHEFWAQNRSGILFPVWVDSQPLYDEDGVLIGVVSVSHDLRPRKYLEQAQNQLATLVQSSQDAIVSIDGNGNILTWNRGAQILCGYEANEIIGHPYAVMVPAKNRVQGESLLERVLRGENISHFETVLRRKNGQSVDVSVTISPLICNERITGASFIARDITEQKRARAAQARSENLYRTLAENFPNGSVYLADTQGRFFLAEGRGTANANVQRSHLLGKTFYEVFSGTPLLETLTAVYERALRKEESALEFESNGHFYAVRVVPVCGSDGAVTFVMAVTQDITERREAEIERDRFFTLALDMMCIADNQGRLKRLNPAFENTLGFSPHELIGKPLWELVHPDDRHATKAAFQSIQHSANAQISNPDDRTKNSSACSLPLVSRYRCRDGSYRWLSWRVVPCGDWLYCAAHDITALKKAEMALHRANDELELRVIERTAELAESNRELSTEISERQRTEEALQESYALLNAVIEGSTDAIFVKDLQGRYLMINSTGAHLRGTTPEQVLGHTDDEFFSPETAQILHEADARVLASGTTQTYEETTVENGVTRTHLVTKGVHRNPHGEVIGIVGMARDITEHKQHADALQRAKDEADQANRAKSEFLSRMSHELRTPLNAILGFGQILEMRPFEREDSQHVTQILKGGWHLLGLINEVLDFARVEGGHLELMLEELSLVEVVSECYALIRPLAAQRDICLHEDGLDTDRHFVLADRQRLKQILLNLLSNAIKYNREGGEVHVVLRQMPDARTRIEVHDTGSGLSADDIAKLFTPFERLHAAHSKIEGTGLGLVLSQQLAQAMRGKLGVASTCGQGSAFWLELPSAPAQFQMHRASTFANASQQNTHVGGQRYSILSIEDNISNVHLLKAILVKRPEITLMSAMQGSIGLDLARQHRPDLILLDLNLPDIWGGEVLERLKRNALTRDIPVIVLSADATGTQIQRQLRAGAKHYLSKPLNVQEFLRVLEETLTLHPEDENDTPSNESASNSPQRATVHAPQRSLNVLVGEDNALNQKLIAHQLESLGHRAHIVGDGKAVLEAWQRANRKNQHNVNLNGGSENECAHDGFEDDFENGFDVILMDCRMPELDGYATTREIRARETAGHHIPIIALTAHAWQEEQRNCLAAGMDDYLSKPIRHSELAQMLARYKSAKTVAAPLATSSLTTSSHAPKELAEASDKSEKTILRDDVWHDLQRELDAQLLNDLVLLFLQEVPLVLASLQRARQNQDAVRVKKLAHKMRGSCATLGVEQMVELCKDIEARAQRDGFQSIGALLENLHHQFETARELLQRKIAAP